jgi:dipeptide transport system substrate-binding protein
MKKILLALLVSVFHLSDVQAANLFRYCVEGSATQLDPNQATDVMTENSVAQTAFNKLVDVDLKTGEFVPSLATKWTVSKDGKVYLFHLRKNVKFHQREDFQPTRDFNADDVVATFKRMMETTTIAFGVFESYGFRKLIESVQKINPNLVEIRLRSPNSNLISGLAHPGMSIHSEEYLRAREKNSALLPIGTGPFVMQKHQADSEARFVRHAQYWNGLPPIQNLVVLFVADSSVRLQKLKAGECDFISELAPTDRPEIEKASQFTLHDRLGFNIGYMGFNLDRPALKDLRVRQAIAKALNIGRYIDLIYMKAAKQAISPLMPDLVGYRKDSPQISTNLEEAKKIVQQLGDQFPKKLRLHVLPISRAYNPSGKKMAELIQVDLKEIGIELELVNYDWQTFLSKARAGDFDLILLGSNLHSRDPGIFLEGTFGCGAIGGFNVIRFCNPQFEKLLTASREATSLKEKEKSISNAIQFFMEEIPLVPIAHGRIARASKKGLTNYYLGSAGREDFSKVDLK